MCKPFILPLVFFLFIFSCDEKEDVRLGPKEIKLSAQQVEIIEGANRFGLDLFREILDSEPADENVFISPLSVHLALSMAWNGAREKTSEQMAAVMNYPDHDQEEINSSISKLINDLLSVDPGIETGIANSVWYRRGFNVERNFLDIVSEYFDALVKDLDFDDPSSVDVINGWVADKTRNRIEGIVDRIDPDHVMFLINAIYFKGIWSTEFVPEETRERPFYLSPGEPVDVLTMETEGEFGYAERDGYRVVELPYGRGNYSMLLFLPDEDVGTGGMQQRLTAEEWKSLTSVPESKRNVNIRLPRFSFEYETVLNVPLSNLGMKDAFVPRVADFSGISRNDDLHVSRVRHKSFVEVNEEGTEAAAVTSVEIRVVSYDPDEKPVTLFHVDRPFLMVIKEKYTNSIVFTGRISNPI